MTPTPTEGPARELPQTRIIPEPAPLQAVPRVLVLKAFTSLIFVDLVLRTRGYVYLRRLLSRATPDAPQSPTPEHQVRMLAAVDRATVYYPRQAMCLQRSAVLTWLLRQSGVQAHLVIGCRHTPFYAHAWVEVDGVVVNDRATVKELYPEMERV